jgi:hypothetical protein
VNFDGRWVGRAVGRLRALSPPIGCETSLAVHARLVYMCAHLNILEIPWCEVISA